MADNMANGGARGVPSLAERDALKLEPDDDGDKDSVFSNASYEEASTTSVASSIIRGHMENGRRFATLREGYWAPVDEKHRDTQDLGHFVYLLLESDRENLLFRSQVKDPKHILDIGTGSGVWAIDCADHFPNAQVTGIDLYPPKSTWVPENCSLEVEDVTKDWVWGHKFDLIHMRYFFGSLTDQEWVELYAKCYENLSPGGWIEQLEPDVGVHCDDDTLPQDSILRTWGDNFVGCAERAGRSILMWQTMKRSIERAGFVNVQEDLMKTPIGAWPKNEKLKEAGRINYTHWTAGLEGYTMYLLTKFGAPKPWTPEEVQAYVDKAREEFKRPKLHIWHYTRRVWAQKPE